MELYGRVLRHAILALLPDPARWIVEHFYWNEPSLRLSFGALHFVNLAAPGLAALVIRLCYQIDRRFTQGRRGHLLGTIRRRDIPSAGS